MFCSSCGQPVDAGSRFCPTCGAATNGGAEPVPPPVALPPANAAPVPPPVPPKPPSPPKVPSASITATAAPSAAAGTSKGKVLAGGIGGGVVGLIVLARVVMHLFGGSVPACDDDSIKLVREILDEHGGKGVDASGFAQVSYDSKAEIRSCKAMLSASGSDDDVAKINYTVEWGDKKENKILVTIKGGD